MTKQNRYTTLQAEAMHARGERAGAATLVLSPLVRFVRFYIGKLGFLDGVPGFVHIAIGCHNSFMKYAKLRALADRGEQGRAPMSRAAARLGLRVLVTGAAGFIGMHVAERLLRRRRASSRASTISIPITTSS